MTSLPCAIRRRGVLLLVVLSMLTLFLMLGVTYLIAASRARETARAYARLTFGSDDARIPAAQLLDSMLLKVVRGPVVTTSGTFESLLADKYGTVSLSGTVTWLSRTGPILSATVSTGSSVRPTDLVGRVLTLAKPGRPVTSHRIVRALGSGSTNASTSSFTLTLDIAPGATPIGLPAVPVPAVVNGREFAGVAPANENWDGFDANNLFLAQLKSSTSVISQADVIRGSFVPTTGSNTFTLATGTTTRTFTFAVSASSSNASLLISGTDVDNDLVADTADNDGDGVIDGVFQDFGIPSVTDAAGNTVQLRASVLVVDLDGRFNVNAHDGLPRLVYGGATNWPDPAVVSTSSSPLGSGYGPSEVNGDKMFTTAPLITQGDFTNSENPLVLTITGGTTYPGRRSAANGSRYSNTETLRLGGTASPGLNYPEGRYGEQAAAGWSNIEQQLISSGTPAKFARPGIPGTDDPVSRINDRRADPTISDSISYGIPSVWWTGTSTFNWAASGTGFPAPRGVFNSPPDLDGRMKTLTLSATGSGIVPRMAFAQPEWSSGTAVGSQNESRDDPYELLLDTRRGRGGLLFDPSTTGSSTASSRSRDNPFTPAESETVLRPYDVDTNKLPPRLAAMLGSAAEESRLKVTTDSWDTTAITGSAALVLFGTQGGSNGWLQATLSGSATLSTGTNPLEGVLGGEIGRGERFDLNRALVASSTASLGYNASTPYWQQRQAYFKDLYTLLVMLSSTTGSPQVLVGGQTLTGTAATAALAQLAANVVDFRDADSTMSTFEYDTNLANGWAPDGNLATTGDADRAEAVGAERPELVIAETFAWENDNTGELFVVLHRPWNATAYGAGSSSIAGEPCDPQLDTGAGQVANTLDLGRKAANKTFTSGETFPVWRLRVKVPNQPDVFARFDAGTAAPGGTTCVSGSVTSAATTPKMQPDSWVCVRGANTIPVIISDSFQQVVLDQGGTFRVPGATGIATATPSRPAVVYLERLTDPLDDPTDTTWTSNPATGVPRYQIVDTGTVNVIYSGAGPGNPNATGGNNGNDKPVGNAGGGGTPTPISWRRIMAGSSAFWKSDFGQNAPGNTLTLAPLSGGAAPDNPRWLPWPNRPFVSAAELLLVPRLGPEQMLLAYDGPVTSASGSNGLAGIQGLPQLLLDAVHVPTRFTGIHATTTSTAALNAAGISAVTTTVNQLSSFREPGRVNLNTVPSDDVWNAVVAGPLSTSATSAAGAGFGITVSGTAPARPAQSMYQLLTLSGTGATIVSDTSTQLAVNLNPLHGIYTATRLANTATPRSNVFGVWITLRESVANDPDSVKYHRAFYIVDRSIAVGFEEGKDYNVWDCVRLRRIIE